MTPRDVPEVDMTRRFKVDEAKQWVKDFGHTRFVHEEDYDSALSTIAEMREREREFTDYIRQLDSYIEHREHCRSNAISNKEWSISVGGKCNCGLEKVLAKEPDFASPVGSQPSHPTCETCGRDSSVGRHNQDSEHGLLCNLDATGGSK
jgi:hypothetical protein